MAPSTPASPETVQAARDLVAQAGIDTSADLIARLVVTSLGLGTDETDRLDLKISSAALSEMRSAFKLFAPYAAVPKVTVFGSARIQAHDPLYELATRTTALLADQGWMVVTGAGPGIMQAAAQGAGPDRSLGVSIRLPFEEAPNTIVGGTAHNVPMKYFFTRKLMLVKESRGFVCLPGGFGTLDETFELLTLQQTGKAEPVPIVLLDRPGGSFWDGLRRFVDDQLVPTGLISADDLDRVLITDSIDAAAREITGFWDNYDSLRWVGKRLVIRLNSAPRPDEVESLNEQFAPLLESGRIEVTDPLAAEQSDNDKLDLPRIKLRFNQRKVGELHRIIRAVNQFDSAPSH